MIKQIKRPTLLVADLDASLSIYRDTLGLKVDAVRVKEPPSSAAPLSPAYEYFGLDPARYTFTRFATLSTASVERAFGLMEITGAPLPRQLPRTTAVICEVQDTRVAAAQLRSRGIEVLSEDQDETPEGVTYVEQPFVDLDGHLIVLYHLRLPPQT